jgi:predicted CXXCH cytochrome family protein
MHDCALDTTAEQGRVRSKKKNASRSARRDDRSSARATGHRATPAAIAAAGLIAIGLFALFGTRYGRQLLGRSRAPSNTAAATFVGSTTCGSCHAGQAADWNKSQHRVAMAEATEQTVLGDFNAAQFTYAGITTEFLRRDGKFIARTDGPDGTLADFEVKYTFGVGPLQQYLIELAGGRVQALSIAWDARSKNQNGQRWFHLYPTERVTSRDELHWTRPSQNWNFMCADCHSTGLRKNYDRATDRFQTTWAEISVGCEACHGPGSLHMKWAGGARTDSSKGLTARLDERRGVAWTANAATGNASRSHPRTSNREIETCAQCHARRTQIADGYEAGKPFLEYYRPALLTRPLYHADGQQRDEVYTWGSFLQSRMYARGVTCSDCHNPHSGKLRAEGNAVCASCHMPSKYETPSHLRHQPSSAGATCVACHMPATNYMVVDPRRDHSLRVPRPDLSVALGTPNACTSCHTNRDARWAAARVTEWYGPKKPSATHERVATTFAAADADVLDGQAYLRALAADSTQSAIVRATAFAELNLPSSFGALATLSQGLKDSNALIRLGALQSVEQFPLESRVALAEPLLTDPVKSIRIEAARLLASLPPQQLSLERQKAFRRASDEYIETQRYNADRAEARVSLGSFLAERGEMAGAELELRSAIRMAPSSISAYVNLADVYRALGRDVDGERILREALAGAPRSGSLHYALGLVLTRLNRRDTALREFARAAGLEPGNARFAYVHAVALHSSGKVDDAIAQLKSALTTHPANADIISALAKFLAGRGDNVQAARYRDQLRALAGNR